MKEFIQATNLANEFYTEEKCYITELSNSSDDANISIARARVASGITTCWHCLIATVEYYYILSGVGIMELGDLPAQSVNVGDIVRIPPMCKQRITNTGAEDLVFLAICSPRFTSDIYIDIEEN